AATGPAFAGGHGHSGGMGMRNFLAFIGAAVLIFFGVGMYLGWYHIYRTPTSDPGHSKLEIDINKDKIGSDGKDGATNDKEAIDKTTTNPNDTAPTTPAKTPSTSKTGLLDLANDGWYSPEKIK